MARMKNNKKGWDKKPLCADGGPHHLIYDSVGNGSCKKCDFTHALATLMHPRFTMFKQEGLPSAR